MSRNADLQLVSSAISRWRNGEHADAKRFLASYPQLKEAKSVVVNLAYEEYCQRTAAGEAVDAETFCATFSRFRDSLCRRLEVHELLAGDPLFQLDSTQIAWPEQGDMICGYRLVEELGEGMVGKVFLAEELELSGRKVVVKITRAGIREAETLSRLSHPNIVPVYSTHYESLSGFYVICMPYMGRHTLQDLIDAAFVTDSVPERFSDALGRLEALEDKGRVDQAAYEEAILRLVIDLCDALSHTHSKDILHLDLKPSNILLGSRRQPLLLDFNLSLDGETRWSLLGGTMPFMSPEQIQAFALGDSSVLLDGRSDLYSLGVILYQLLTGKHPFGGINWRQSPEAVGMDLRAIQKRGPADIKVLNRRLSPTLSKTIATSLSFNRADRPATAGEFADLLRKELSFWPRSKRYWRRNKAMLRLCSGIATLSIAALTAAWASQEPFSVQGVRRGWQFYASSEYEAAQRTFAQVVDHDYTTHEAHFGLGRVHQRLGQFDEAYRRFTQAHELSADGRYSACRGFSASAIGKDDVAVARYDEAIKEGFDTREVWLLKGRSYARIGAAKDAEASMLKAVQIDRRYSLAWLNLANLYQSKMRDANKALHSIEQSIAGDSPRAEMYLTAAMIACSQPLPRLEDRLRGYLSDGAEAGVCWQDCVGRPYARMLPEDDPAIAAIKGNPQRTDRLVLGPDPLGDAEIARRAIGGN